MILPLRMVQASATAAAEQPCAAPICASVGSRSKLGAGAAERRISHHRHVPLLAPWQKVTFNAALAEVVKHLIGRAAIAMWNANRFFHVVDIKVGYAPGANFTRSAQVFERHHGAREVGDPISPMQQIEIEMIRAETSEACLASARNTVFRRTIGRHLGDQEYTIPLASNYVADQFLGAVDFAVSINVIPSERPVRRASSSSP